MNVEINPNVIRTVGEAIEPTVPRPSPPYRFRRKLPP